MGALGIPVRWALTVCALVILAGCTGPTGPSEDPPPAEGLGFSARTLDTDGDRRTDTLELRLVQSATPIPRGALEVRLEEGPVELAGFGNATTWQPGATLTTACPAGMNEYRVLVHGELVRVLVLECGIEPPFQPPFFRASLTDGDGDGDRATVELTLTSGGPVPAGSLTARFGETPLRLYADALKSQRARGPVENGTALYTPCDPQADDLVIVADGHELPALKVRGCEAYEPGIDAPIDVAPTDVDADGAVDGLNLTLGASDDAPFPLDTVNATWGNASASLNASTGLEPPPARWRANTSLVATCPREGEQRFELRIDGSPALRRFVVCQAPPGRPLIDLNLTVSEDRLDMRLELSRVGPLALENVTTPAGEPLGEGSWSEDETVSLACPGGQLVLHYGQRLAYRAPAPC